MWWTLYQIEMLFTWIVTHKKLRFYEWVGHAGVNTEEDVCMEHMIGFNIQLIAVLKDIFFNCFYYKLSYSKFRHNFIFGMFVCM